jgi:dinuclear metal center YbgI/SA1388 family protein
LLEAPNQRPLKNIFLTIDLTLDTLDEAISKECSLIIAYHPPIFTGFKRLVLEDPKQEIILKCVAEGISIYSPHTALDSCVGGINDWIASCLGPGQLMPITAAALDLKGQEGAGVGRIFTFDKPMMFEDIIIRVKAHLGLDYVRKAVGYHKPIRNVAICAGSGYSVISSAKCDLYITGEMSHHETLACIAKKSNVILCEHSNSERGYLQVFKDLLNKELDSEYKIIVSTSDKDPLSIS